jgi:hypothetical protein
MDLEPTATFNVPVVLAVNAALPTAVLLAPVLTCKDRKSVV